MNRNVKIGIIGCILLVTAVAVFSKFHKEQENSKFLKVVDRNVTTEDRKVFEDRIIDLQNKLGATNDNGAKYNYYINIGQYKYALGLLQESKDAYDEALKISSDQYDVYLHLFLTQMDMTDYRGAEQSIKKAISIRKGNADLWKRYIQLRIEKVNSTHDEVIKLFNDALNDTGKNGDVANHTDILTYYATWLEKTGNIAGAINYWNRAIEVNPESKKIYQAEIDRLNKLVK